MRPYVYLSNKMEDEFSQLSSPKPESCGSVKSFSDLRDSDFADSENTSILSQPSNLKDILNKSFKCPQPGVSHEDVLVLNKEVDKISLNESLNMLDDIKDILLSRDSVINHGCIMKAQRNTNNTNTMSSNSGLQSNQASTIKLDKVFKHLLKLRTLSYHIFIKRNVIYWKQRTQI